ncbi:PREDICTED: neutral ceramidase [Polistes canadensis]|uniref:neutral ceramidase n=1 Tax=Polistes canadensis TaxID=91411 RepID=UPI000718DDDF|nr:PREDICTED: neutral ceramidase [Polistes canadensis]
MDTKRLRLNDLSALWIVFILLMISPSCHASYSIGVGIADSTGPPAEIVFMGYAKMDQKGSGIHLRTFSRAFIIDDGEERFVFVSVDSSMIGIEVRKEVLNKLKSQYDNLYTEKNVMISGTHTHSSPGGFMMDVLFDLTTYGFSKECFNAIVNGITNSIRRAHDSVVPGRIFITQGEIFDANINRSPIAYLNNPKEERDKYDHDVDKTITQLQFVGVDNRPLGVINWFAVHPTSMNNTNHLISSDNVGYASILFEKMMNKDAMIGKGPFVASFASTNLGDVSPNTRGPKCEFSGLNCTEQSTCPGKKEMCFASGPGKDMFESTSIIATKLFNKATDLWKNGRPKEVVGPIRVVHQFVDMPKESATFYNKTTGEFEKVYGCLPAMGYSFAAGTTDGPGSFSFEQGTTTSNPFWNAVRNFLAAPTDEDIRCHSPKPILLATGRMKFPYQWQPRIVSTQVAFIGNVIIAGVPGEFTTMSGRRLREAIKTATNSVTYDEDYTVIIAGLCNTYSDYITTPEEYQIQRYEGASTIYGPHTLTIYLKLYQNLVMSAIQKKEVNPGPSPQYLSSKKMISFITPVLFDAASWGYNFGDCVIQPNSVVYPGDIVKVSFISGHPRNNLMTDETYLIIERLAINNNTWITVATDADWETKFEWVRKSVVLGSSQVYITWEIPKDVKLGEYRIKHFGYYRYILGGIYSYQGTTNSFNVVQSDPNISRIRYS